MKFIKIIESILVAVRNVILGANLISLSLLTSPRKMLFYITQNLFFFKTFSAQRELPQRNVFEVLPANNTETISLGNLNASTWFGTILSPASDITSLSLICRIMKPKVIFEIGTLIGYTALHFALNSPDDAKIFTLDLPRGKNMGPGLKTTVIDDEFITLSQYAGHHCFENSDISSRITCLYGDSANFDFSPFYGKVDFFFIDGAHSYEYARSDTLNALKCCHPGSVIAWHDYGQMGMSGVSKWLHEFSKAGNDIYSIPGGSLAFMVVKDK